MKRRTESEVERVDDGLCDTESEVEAGHGLATPNLRQRKKTKLISWIALYPPRPPQEAGQNALPRWLNCTPRDTEDI
jgi:hypothetical protein